MKDAIEVTQLLEKIQEQVSPQDAKRIRQLAEAVDGDGRVRVAGVLPLLYPGASKANALAGLRQLRARLRSVAEEVGVDFELVVQENKRAGAQRWAEFQGPDLTLEHAIAFATTEAPVAPNAVKTSGIALPETRDGKTVIRWFVSYAREDLARADEFLERLKTALKLLSPEFQHEFWLDKKILPGDEWKDEIIRKLKASDYGLLLLSRHFYTSEFLTRVELPYFLDFEPTDRTNRPSRRLPAIPVALERVSAFADTRGIKTLQIYSGEADNAFMLCHRETTKRAFVDGLAKRIDESVHIFVAGRYAQASAPAAVPSKAEHALASIEARLREELPRGAQRTRGVADGMDKADDMARRREIPPAQRIDALEDLERWLDDPEAPGIYALLGEYGMGKTTTCRMLTRHLIERRKFEPAGPMPVYLDLRHVTGLERGVPTLDEVLQECLRRGWYGGPRTPALSADDIVELWREGALVIFDGLDEVLVHLSEKDGQAFTRELLKLRPRRDEAGKPVGGKLVIACRTHYFRTLRAQRTHFTTEDRDPVQARDYRALVLLPFEPDQIAEYFRSTLPEADLDRLLATLRSVHNLEELATRPYTLSLIAAHIPRIEALKLAGATVRGVTLYREMVLSWLERDTGKHVIKPDHKQRLMEHLAAELWRRGRRVWSATDLEDWFGARLHGEPALALRYGRLDADVLEEDLRTATFLVRQDGGLDAGRDDTGGFRFAHSSLQEYFLARYLRRALEEQRLDELALPLPSPETLDFLGQLLEVDQPERALAGLAAVLSAYRPRASELALAYTLRAHARGYPYVPTAGCQLAGAELSGWDIAGRAEAWLDLSGADLSGARLDNARLHYLRLDDAKLRGTRLLRAELLEGSARRADFTEADLTGCTCRLMDLGASVFGGTQVHRAALLRCTVEGVRALPPALTVVACLPETPAHPPHKPTPAAFLGHGGGVRALAYAPDGRALASAGYDHTVRLWDPASGHCTATLRGHENWVFALAYAPDGRTLASAGNDGTVRLWDMATGACLRIHQIAPDGHAVFEPRSGGRILEMSGGAWRWMGWAGMDPQTGQLDRWPAEIFGLIPEGKCGE